MPLKRRIPRSSRCRTGVAAAALALLAGLLAAVQGTSAAASAPALPHIPADIPCAALVQTGGSWNQNVPDFGAIPGAPTRIESATITAATEDAPEYCLVRGYVQTQIKFELKLPTTQWQGRYLQVGCGGFCGAIANTQFPDCREDLGGDFAIAATDTGHQTAQSTDAMWAGASEQARVDFGHRGVHVVAVAAKEIQKAYYGQAPVNSYFMGCSDGGREALMEAQRYPGDFDGIVAGAPANNMSTNPLWLGHMVQMNLDESDEPILTQEKLASLSEAVLADCDANDGIEGNGLIGDPRDCDFDPQELLCPGDGLPTCLTAEQVEVVQAFYDGVYDDQGRRLDPRGLPRGSESTWAPWVVPVPPNESQPEGTAPSHIARAFGESASRWLSYPIGQGKRLNDVEFTKAEFDAMFTTARHYDALDADLSAFADRGGRLLLYTGQADALVPASQAIDYYDAVRSRAGGQAAADAFVRFFAIPGMGHCGGGPTPNTSELLLQVVNWVEEGTAPSEIRVRDEFQGAQRERPIYRYPLESRLIDPGMDPNDAASYEAVEPEVERVDQVEWVGDHLLRPDEPSEPQEPAKITVRLKGKNNGKKADRLEVTMKPAAQGAKATLFRVNAKGKLVKVETKRLGAKGKKKFKVKDRNGSAKTTYLVKVAGTVTTKPATSNKRKVR